MKRQITVHGIIMNRMLSCRSWWDYLIGEEMLCDRRSKIAIALSGVKLNKDWFMTSLDTQRVYSM